MCLRPIQFKRKVLNNRMNARRSGHLGVTKVTAFVIEPEIRLAVSKFIVYWGEKDKGINNYGSNLS